LSNNNIITLQDLYEFKVENKYLIRLHEHGLLRLITLNTEPKFFKVTKKVFFHSLLNNHVYQELFFDHYTQQSTGKHGPFLTKNLTERDFIIISKEHLKNEVIQIVSSPKWSCPPISKESLSKVKYLLNRFVNESSILYFLERCLDFNASFNEAKVYEHEWSHSLSSYYEYLIHDPENNKIHMLIMTYE
jgi:hypothetical protein